MRARVSLWRRIETAPLGLSCPSITTDLSRLVLGRARSYLCARSTMARRSRTSLARTGRLFIASAHQSSTIASTSRGRGRLLHVDPIWLGVVMVMNIEIALLTPPVGMNMYVIQSVSKLPIQKVIRGEAPFIVISALCLGAVLAFPSLATWLPGTMH